MRQSSIRKTGIRSPASVHQPESFDEVPSVSDLATLCLLPGLLCDATVWVDQLSAFRDSATVVIPDFHGLDSITGMAERVLAQTSGPISVAGHSMGGRVALEVLRLAPERVERLALLDTGFHPAGAAEPAQRQVLVDLANEEGMSALVRQWLPPMVHPDRLSDEALMQPLRDMIHRASPEIYEKQIHALLHRPDATGQLPAIACPTAVLCGRQDAWSPLDRHIEMARIIPGAELTIVEECGHMSTVERPEIVTEALRSWLAQ
jgi:pimeloyl-ACP methyl ester carboxylesterase